MAQSQCIRIKLKEGATEKFVSWIKAVHARKEELDACVTAEGILAEHLFLERSPSGDYITFYTRAKDLAECSNAFQQSDRKLDKEMKEMIESTWDVGTATKLELLLDI